MRYFFDTEFIEDGKTIELISIGLISEDGREFYAESNEYDAKKASPWVKAHVFPKLKGGALDRKAIAKSIKAFVGPQPEFWAYYADYDWVVLCQLYGTMMELPESWPKYCMDLKQLMVERGNPNVPIQQAGHHNALSDAAWVRGTWLCLRRPY